MRRADSDENAGFADLETAEAVNDGDAVDGKFLVEGLADLPHLGESHGFVGLVIEVHGAAAVGFVAHETIEVNDGAVLIGAHALHDSGCVDGRLHQSEKIVFCGGVEHRCDQPPLTGGRKAIVSFSANGLSHAANSWLQEATSEDRNAAN